MAALVFVAILIGGAFLGLAIESAGDFSGAAAAFDSYLFRIVRFTLWQAVLSTCLSVVPALFVARALARHPGFFGRNFILQLFAVPLALPAIVAALGVLALYGRAGYFAPFLTRVTGEDWPGIYGLSGILVAHVFFNLHSACACSSRRCRPFRRINGGWPANSAWACALPSASSNGRR